LKNYNFSYQKSKFAIKFFLLLSLIFLFSNCSQDNTEESPDLIEQHQFAEILAECQLVESQGTVLRIEQPYFKDSLHNYYASVFEKYKITPDQFYESLQYYAKDPNLMQVIYSETLEILQSKIANFEDLEVPSKAIAPISNAVLAEIILDTPFYQRLLDDSLTLSPLLRDSIFNFLDSFPDIAKENTTNNASAQFTFGIHQKNSGMYEQLLKLIINNIDKKNGKD
jgi:hypothetical protein